MLTRGSAVATVLCLGAVGPCAGFHTGVLPALRSSGTALVPARSARATTPALSRLSMAFDADAIAAAAERGKQREKVIEEKRKAREAKERAARDVERYALLMNKLRSLQRTHTHT